MLAEAFDRLLAAGAGVIAMPCNTLQVAAAREAARRGVPFVDMIEATARAAGEHAVLIATEGTIAGGYYEGRGVELETPPAELQREVGELIGRAVHGTAARTRARCASSWRARGGRAPRSSSGCTDICGLLDRADAAELDVVESLGRPRRRRRGRTARRRVSATVGLLGAGRMGAGICAALVRAGHDVLAFDVRAEREEEVRAAGARWAPDAAALAAAADVLVSSLPGSPELTEAMAALIGELRPGASWIDTTSAAPAVAAPLVAAASARGVDCLDAPVGGGPAEAAAGTLRLYVGGSPATLERSRGVLEALGTVEHMGAAGAGYTTKLLVNLLWFGQALATARGDAARRALGDRPRGPAPRARAQCGGERVHRPRRRADPRGRLPPRLRAGPLL